MVHIMQMEQNSKPVDTSPTFKGQNQAQNVESTLSSQATKVMMNLEAVLMMKDLETDPTIIPLIRRCMIVLERISDLEMDLQCLPTRERAIIVRDRIIGQIVSGSATCFHHDCRIGEQSNINYSDLVTRNLETVLMMKDFQSNPLIKRCMIVLKRISDLEMDLQCLPRRKRATIVRGRIIGQNVSGSATCSHQDCRTGEQNKINAPISLDQQESNLQRPAAEKQPSDDNHQDCNDAQNQLAVYSPADSAPNGTDSRPLQNQANEIVYTAQCSFCSKWRFLPSKKKFEEICERNLEKPFLCADVREWRPEISCNDVTDLREDGNWAIEKQNIARPPLGWERLLKIRRSRGTRFADVYYFTPSGERLRSRVDVQRYLDEHPDEAERVALSQFSFRSPSSFCWNNNQARVREPKDSPAKRLKAAK